MNVNLDRLQHLQVRLCKQLGEFPRLGLSELELPDEIDGLHLRLDRWKVHYAAIGRAGVVHPPRMRLDLVALVDRRNASRARVYYLDATEMRNR